MADFDIKDYKYKEPVHVEMMEDVANWVAGESGVTTEDTTNVRVYETLKKSVSFTTTGATTVALAIKALAGATDLTNTDIVISFYVGDPADVDNMNTITLAMSADAGFATDSVSREFYIESQPLAKAGWQQVKISAASHRNVTGSLETALSACTHLRIRMATIGATTPTIVIDSIRFVPAAPKATYFLTFDDGKDTDLLVTSYLDSKGLKGTFNISPNKIETEGDRLTISQMLTMQNNGHLIANHSWDGEDLRDDSLSFNQGVDSIVKATDWMVTNGFSKGSKNWTVPGGTGNSYGWVDGAIVNDWELLKPYCDTIRHTDTEALRPAGILSGKNLFTVDFDAPADAIDYLNQNYIDNGSVVIFGFHSWAATVSSGGVLTSDFTDLIDALAALVASGDAEVMTLDDISAPPSIVAAKGAYRGRYSGGRR